MVAPSSHLVTKEEHFINRITQTARLYMGKDITLGIKPTYPEVGVWLHSSYTFGGRCFGRGRRFYPVKTFIEKPKIDMARILVDTGEFFWNAGLFVAQAGVLLDAFRVHSSKSMNAAVIEVWVPRRSVVT